MKSHVKALCAVYPFSKVGRFQVNLDKVKWTTEYKEYDPPDYTAPTVLNKPVWADCHINSKDHKLAFNKVDGKINRVSFTGHYAVSEDGLPLNPIGRTGVRGRGILGKWGPNHAADPIVTRWKRDNNGNVIVNEKSQKKILQFVGVKRKDTNEWALPGGMVDDGENVSLTLKREFGEEALNSLQMSVNSKKQIEKLINELFSKGYVIYKGYVDDHRNTDNAWMETIAVNFHDENGNSVSMLPLSAGDDAGSVAWIDISSTLNLYASHSSFVEKVAILHGSHW